MATAKELIEDLKGQGWSNSRIAKALGRDSSTISQITRKNKPKPGANLVGPLQALLSGAEKVEPERRKTKSGAVAKVRKPAVEKVGEADKPLLVKAKPKSETAMMRELRGIAAEDGKLAIRVEFEAWQAYHDKEAKPGTAVLFRHGGIKAAEMLDEMARTGEGLSDWILRQVEEQLKPEVMDGMGEIQFAVTY